MTAPPIPSPSRSATRKGPDAWSSCGTTATSLPFPLDYLRSWCPCASCQGHAPTARYLDLAGQELAHLEGVGNYAIAPTWADGHSTGIYSFKLLRALCPCAACGGEKR